MCVIGAGSSGLTAVKALKEVGLSPDCYEMGTKVGGLWAFDNENGRGGAYRSLHINTSTKAMEFSDFPMPTDIGDFPSHVAVGRYFHAYAEHFGLFENVRFRVKVLRCEPRASGYRVTLEDLSTKERWEKTYNAVVVANGHHFSPAYPDRSTFDAFTGIPLHSHDYLSPCEPTDLASLDVLVVGMGNSAVDIASELATSETHRARRVCVAARRGAWVLPKYILGKPLDQGRVIPMWLPSKLRRRVVTAAFRWMYGKMTDYGLPEPDHLIGEAHPTVSSEFAALVQGGAISMRRGFSRATGKTVTFDDGTQEDFDAIVFCTGYDIVFPFFDEQHVSAPDNVLPLYHRAFHLDERHVFFVGLAQTVGAIMPVAEAQARAIAAHLSGTYNLPDQARMKARVEQQTEEVASRFVASRRHTMQVIPEDFLRELRDDLRAGKVRAQRGRGLAFPSLSAPS